MGTGARVFYAIGTFLGLMAVFYIIATSRIGEDAWRGGMEWVGGAALVLATLMSFMLGVYLDFTERRMDIVPEDWEEAEIEDGAGVLGFFSASSIWPFWMTVSIVVMGAGLAWWHLWLVAFGAVMLIWATTMLNLQYGLPPEKH